MATGISQYFIGSITNLPSTQQQILELEAKLNIILPQSYKDFLLITNGFEGTIGNSYAAFETVQNIYQSTLANCAEFFPWAIFIGSDGGGEMYIIDKRTSPVQFGLLPFIGDDEDFIPLGSTFEILLKRLNEGSVF